MSLFPDLDPTIEIELDVLERAAQDYESQQAAAYELRNNKPMEWSARQTEYANFLNEVDAWQKAVEWDRTHRTGSFTLGALIRRRQS